jgi:8-oxo-dGTP pyrophosphatase MutT (NUDIX family)
MQIAASDTSKVLTPMSGATSQVAAIPIRWTGGRAEVLLVTTRATGRWTVPKGWPMADSLGAECAAREAFEEAGVRGHIEPYSLGIYEYWKRAKKGRLFLQVTAFALHVEEVAWDWPERKERRRAWFSVDVACKLVANDDLSALIREAIRIGALGNVDYARRPAAGLAN